MKLDTFSTHLEWEITTVVGFDNPDDWKPGDPDRYFVRGVATLPPGCRDSLTADSAHFTDQRLAGRYHGEVTAKLRTMIEERRNAEW